MSWHLHSDDLALFDHVDRVATAEGPIWDEHTTVEKYQRLAELTRHISRTRR
jgi:hypothetical protein